MFIVVVVDHLFLDWLDEYVIFTFRLAGIVSMLPYPSICLPIGVARLFSFYIRRTTISSHGLLMHWAALEV